MNGRNLRDLKLNTELLILVELLDSPSAKLSELAKTLGITAQAVSQYISTMLKEGLVRDYSGKLRPTRKGMQLLQEHFTNLKGEVDAVLRRISVIDRCVAIAGKKISKGQKVGLVMEDGMLMAMPDQKASSTGRATEDAEEGDDVLIATLEGIVDMELGELLVIEAPAEMSGGSKAANAESVRERIESASPGLIAAGDIVGAALLSKSVEEMVIIHAPIESSMSALSKGVDVVYCGTRDSVEQMLDAVASLKKETGYEIKWKVYRA